jgi:hypothetical protein
MEMSAFGHQSRSRITKINVLILSGSKKQTLNLKETKNLYGRLMVLARSNRDINQKNAVGNYEFTLTPRALFATDGSMLPCTDKSKLIHALEKLADSDGTDEQTTISATDDDRTNAAGTSSTRSKIAIVDGMVLIQRMTKQKKGTFSTVKDFGHNFNDKLTSLTAGFDEVILVFDTYEPDSLKAKTRERRRQGKAPVQYLITDDTSIKHIPLTRFLSHDATKADLTIYLAQSTIDFKKDSPQIVITSASGLTRPLQFEANNHEEADTLMICLAVEASQRHPDAQLVIFTPDTDV